MLKPVSVGVVIALAAVLGMVSPQQANATLESASATPQPSTQGTPPPGAATAPTTIPRPTATEDALPKTQRETILGGSYRSSRDLAWTTSGDAGGLHVLVAPRASGYEWRTLATLAEPGIDADAWIGNSCMTGDRKSIVVAYAPRTATNKQDLFDRGGFVAVVRVADGRVRKLAVTSTMAYFSPACGAKADALVTEFRQDDKGGATRLLRIDANRGTVSKPVQVAGELTSAIPVGNSIVAADSNALVSVNSRGKRKVLAVGRSGPFRITPDARGGVVYLDRDGSTASYHRVSAQALARPNGSSTVIASGPLQEVGITNAPSGEVFLTGKARPRGSLPAGITVLGGSSTSATVSSTGALVVESVTPASVGPRGAKADPSRPERPVEIHATVRDTSAKPSFVVLPAPGAAAGDQANHPSLRTGESGRRSATTRGSSTNPVESERTCSVPRNDVRNQVMQPKPRQVEWAVDRAVEGDLRVSRPANWKNLAMPSYSPQGLFPSIPLSGGGTVPPQVMLGVIAQESNMWQAPGSVVPGVTGNPLVGNYYGLKLYDSSSANDWDVDFANADCGYGVTQITDGMRLRGQTRPGEVALPYQKQRAVALDYATNVAAGLQILQRKWNQTRDAGLTINDGNPAWIENWFYAVWAYNSGMHPQSEAGSNGGAWGVGWFNNPANPRYPANRPPFMQTSRSDAKTPQNWPYPEKVMGWAASPVEVLESPGNPVIGFRAAWWNTGGYRYKVSPPIDTFCTQANNCYPGGRYQPNEPGTTDEPAGPCAHKNSAGQYDLRCWSHEPATWKDCGDAAECGYPVSRFDSGYGEQADGTAYPPQCTTGGLPAGALIVDDQPDGAPVVRPGCNRRYRNSGTFRLNFAADQRGEFTSKTDFHQLGAGFGGHFWYAHTRTAGLRGGSMKVTGTWSLNRKLNQWAEVYVHVPDLGAHTQQAAYQVDTGRGKKTRVILQRTMRNEWVSLGVFRFYGTPKVRLTSQTYDGDGPNAERPDGDPNLIENEDIAYDAVAFKPLSAKPGNFIVALGDSYSSGEGGSGPGGRDYYPETDNNGDFPESRNACHRSKYAWSRWAVLPGTHARIGARSDAHDPNLDYHLLACSGAKTKNLLPYHTAGTQKPTDALGQQGRGQYGELSQLDRGFLDENTTLVTVSIGGNDALFGPVLQACLNHHSRWDKCEEQRIDDKGEMLGIRVPKTIRREVRPSIETTLSEIHRRAPRAKVVLMGYPNLFAELPTDTGCLTMSHDDVQWVNKQTAYMRSNMNAAAKAANRKAGRQYVWFSDPQRDFAEKGVCTTRTAHIRGIVPGVVRGPYALTPGEPKGKKTQTSQQSFHPNLLGQRSYAKSLERTLTKFGVPFR